MIHVTHMSVHVDDQAKALAFYTDVLGFQAKQDVDLGGGVRWLTVVSPAAPDGTEIVLEPAEHPAVKPYRDALVEDGIPWTTFGVEDVQAEHDRLVARGVHVIQPPRQAGPVTTCVFDDTCGNLIQLHSM